MVKQNWLFRIVVRLVVVVHSQKGHQDNEKTVDAQVHLPTIGLSPYPFAQQFAENP